MSERERGNLFRSTSPAGLDHSLLPMRLWHEVKKPGTSDPRDIDLTQGRRDWQRLRAEQRDVLLRLTSLFQAGEESVTLELLPLIQVIAGEGRLEEEIYLTSFLWEEAKHLEAFRRFFDEVAQERSFRDAGRGRTRRRPCTDHRVSVSTSRGQRP